MPLSGRFGPAKFAIAVLACCAGATGLLGMPASSTNLFASASSSPTVER
jgi:hypothetical protein